jgi:hypothetical protein
MPKQKTNTVAQHVHKAREKTAVRIRLVGELDDLIKSGRIRDAVEFCAAHNMVQPKELRRLNA